jgi:hypothetical protein
LPERLVNAWTADQPVSAEAAASLPAALAEAEAMAQPVDRKALTVLLNRTLKLWKLPEDWPELAPFYLEALADAPQDLVEAALRHCRLNLDWFPRPKHLRAPIEQELQRRKDVLRRVRTMALKAGKGDVEELPWTPATPEEKAQAAEMAQQARTMLKAVKRVPADDAEDLAAITRNEKRREVLANAYKALEPLKAKPRIPTPMEATQAAQALAKGQP